MPRSPRRRHKASRGGGVVPAVAGVTGSLVAWYDFSDISTLFQDNALTSPVTANGQQIKGVVDKSSHGNNLNASSSTGPAYTTGAINGRAAADYVAATPNWLGRATFVQETLAQPGTEILVVKTDLTPTFSQITDAFNGGANRWSVDWSAATASWYAGTNQSFGTVSTTNPQITVAGYNGASSKAWLDGGTGTVANVGAGGKQGLRLGIEDAGSSNPFDGRYCEYILYNRSLTLTEINAIGSYLSTKWGATWTTAT